VPLAPNLVVKCRAQPATKVWPTELIAFNKLLRVERAFPVTMCVLRNEANAVVLQIIASSGALA